MRIFHAIPPYAALLWIVWILTLPVSCAVISDEIGNEALPQLPFDELVQSAGSNHGRVVIVGGYVLSVENRRHDTHMVAIQAPLGAGQQPKSKDLSKGRLILVFKGFIDPEVYTKDRQITVGGRMIGSSTTEKHQHAFPYLRVQVEQVHLWREREPVSTDPYWWDDDCFAYPYGWWRHRRPYCW